jgi:hypothetical protein
MLRPSKHSEPSFSNPAIICDCWRGDGWDQTRQKFRIVVELIKMLLDGIGVIPLFNNARHGKIEEFPSAIPLILPEKSFSPFLPPPG